MAGHLDLELQPETTGFGKIFEHFLITEIKNRLEYSEKSFSLSYLASTNGVEVDLVLDVPGTEPVLIEIKSSIQLIDRHFKNLRMIKDDFPKSRRIILYRGSHALITDDQIEVYPWKAGIDSILRPFEMDEA
jgi:predicted AAA+ superfamily ATPase